MTIPSAVTVAGYPAGRGAAAFPARSPRRRPARRPDDADRLVARPSRSRRSGAPPASRCRKPGARGRSIDGDLDRRPQIVRVPVGPSGSTCSGRRSSQRRSAATAAACSSAAQRPISSAPERRLAEMVDHDRQAREARGELGTSPRWRGKTQGSSRISRVSSSEARPRAPSAGGSSAGRARCG